MGEGGGGGGVGSQSFLGHPLTIFENGTSLRGFPNIFAYTHKRSTRGPTKGLFRECVYFLDFSTLSVKNWPAMYT